MYLLIPRLYIPFTKYKPHYCLSVPNRLIEERAVSSVLIDKLFPSRRSRRGDKQSIDTNSKGERIGKA